MSIMRVRAKISGLEGLPGLHTTYWNGTTATPDAADADDCVDRVRAFWDSFKGNLASGVIIEVQTPVDILTVATGELVGAETASTTSVTSTGTGALPSQVQMLLQLLTSDIVAGRKLQGRSFIGPLEAAANSGGLVASGYNTSLTTAADFLVSGGATASALVVWHRPSLALPNGGSVGVVTGFGTKTGFSSLRSRRD